MSKLSLLHVGLLAVLISAIPAAAQDKVSLSGTIASVACTQACGVCCATHTITDSSGQLTLEVGNSFTDLAKFSNGEMHEITGYFYTANGQCGIGECTLFTVEKVDHKQVDEPSYDPGTQRLSIQSLVINDVDNTRYTAILSAPFNIDSSAQITETSKLPQGADCSGESAICGDGTVCLSYFGIGGSSGPEFKTCEIPCSHPGASCPLGQACTTIADGPGQVCVVD